MCASWHRDKPPCDGWPLPHYRVVKAIVYLWDVRPGGGATGLVPGSHRLPEGPRQTLYGRYTRGDQDVGGADDGDNSIGAPPTEGPALPHSLMPNHLECVGTAGTAVCFDTSIWHTGLPNVSRDDRRSVIVGYRKTHDRCILPRVPAISSRTGSSETRGPGHACGLSEATVHRLAREGKLPPVRRRLMGLSDEPFPQVTPDTHHI